MSPVELGIVAAVLIAGAGVFAWAIRRAAKHGEAAGKGGAGGFLCDDCKYNDVRYCSRPERPNATACEEFKAQRD